MIKDIVMGISIVAALVLAVALYQSRAAHARDAAEFAKVMLSAEKAANAELRRRTDERDALAVKLSKSQEELENANSAVVADHDTRVVTKRVYIRTQCPAPTGGELPSPASAATSGVQAKAEVVGEVRQDILSFRRELAEHIGECEQAKLYGRTVGVK